MLSEEVQRDEDAQEEEVTHLESPLKSTEKPPTKPPEPKPVGPAPTRPGQ